MSEVVTLPFEKAPCACVSSHTPRSLTTQQHHIWPQYDQENKHGRVVDHTTVPLCATAHDNIHAALRAWLKGKPYHLGNAHQRRIALEGYAKIREES